MFTLLIFGKRITISNAQ